MSNTLNSTLIKPSDIELVYYGNQTLRQEAEAVLEFTAELKHLVISMYNIMKTNNGIGLAAPQVNLAKQIIAVDLEAYDLGRTALVNPRIVYSSREVEPYREGCLSIPGIYEDVVRPVRITVQALTIDGKETKIEADGIFARVLQHEIDHLHGILFVDHLEDYIRKEHTKELKQIKKMNRPEKKKQ